MTPGEEMAMVLAKIDAWLREKEYASGHRTGELLKAAAEEIRRQKKHIEELTAMVYETGPGEFSPDGWTWKQAFTAEKARRIEAEAARDAKNTQEHT